MAALMLRAEAQHLTDEGAKAHQHHRYLVADDFDLRGFCLNWQCPSDFSY